MALFCLTGCAGFFPPLTTTPGGPGNTTGNYAYIASSFLSTVSGTSSVYTIKGFAVGTGTLTAISGAAQTLAVPPSAIVVMPSNSFLYVVAAGVLYGYSISSTTGALTQVLNNSGGQVLGNANIVSMAVSPDGQWLLGVDARQDFVQIDEFQIGSTGLLGGAQGASYTLQSGANIVASNIAVSPDGNYIAASLGTGGVVLFSLTTSTGAVAPVLEQYAATSSSADQAAIFDPSSSILNVAVSGTSGGVYPYIIGSGGTLTQVAGAPFALGTTSTAGPASILVDKSGKYLYVGNRTDGSISGFLIGTGGVLTGLTGSPYAAGTTVSALGYDKTGTYILATASGGSPDLQMYSFDTTNAGMLDTSTTALTGSPTEPAGAIAIALTH